VNLSKEHPGGGIGEHSSPTSTIARVLDSRKVARKKKGEGGGKNGWTNPINVSPHDL